MIVEKQMECRLSGKTEVLGEKTCSSATFVHHKIPHDQARVWTRAAAAVGSWRLTAWAMARPNYHIYENPIWIVCLCTYMHLTSLSKSNTQKFRCLLSSTVSYKDSILHLSSLTSGLEQGCVHKFVPRHRVWHSGNGWTQMRLRVWASTCYEIFIIPSDCDVVKWCKCPRSLSGARNIPRCRRD
jgi:hypothetical protein